MPISDLAGRVGSSFNLQQKLMIKFQRNLTLRLEILKKLNEAISLHILRKNSLLHQYLKFLKVKTVILVQKQPSQWLNPLEPPVHQHLTESKRSSMKF